MQERADPERLNLNHYGFQQVIDTQFSDLDVLGHLNNVAIARIYQDARARFFSSLFERKIGAQAPEGNSVLVKSTYEYLAEGFFPDPVIVALNIERVGNSSFTLQQALFQNDRCIGLGDVLFVFMAEGKSRRLPEFMRTKLLATIADRK